MEHGDKEQVVPMGSKDVPIALTKEELFAGLHYLYEHSRCEALVEIDTVSLGEAEVGEEPNLEVGYLERVDSRMLLLTKLRRAPVTGDFERGKSPRANRACAVDGGTPSLIAAEREKNCLSLRNDLDSDGMLRLDIGGKTDDPKSPDFIVAKMISLGGWYYAQLHGKELTDYHADLDMMTEEEFEIIMRRYRRAVHYASDPLRVDYAPVAGVQPGRHDAQILDLPPRWQDQIPAA